MAPSTTLFDGIERAFSSHSCLMAAGLGSVIIGGYAPSGGGTALLIPAAALAAAKCISNPYPGGPGAGIPMLGGQCNAQYYVRIQGTWKDDRGTFPFDSGEMSLQGPIGAPFIKNTAAIPGVIAGTQSLQLPFNSPQSPRQIFLTNTGPEFRNASIVSYRFTRLDRDGLPDNCGNLPFRPYPVPQPVPPPVIPPLDPDGNPILPGNTYNIEFQPNVNFAPVFIPITIGPFVIKPDIKFPISFKVSIDGLEIGKVVFDIDGNFRVDISSEPTEPTDTSELMELLQEIKECACGGSEPPVCPSDTVFVPYVTEQGDCMTQVFPLEVIPGSMTEQKSQLLIETASLAGIGCEALKPVEQLPEVLIFAATTLSDGRELFSGEIGPEVISLRIKITAINNDRLEKIKTYPAANQYKFGSVSFVASTVSGGGDYLYVFDSETYYPLPVRGKTGKLRVLMKSGLSFEVYDTGERVRREKRT